METEQYTLEREKVTDKISKEIKIPNNQTKKWKYNLGEALDTAKVIPRRKF